MEPLKIQLNIPRKYKSFFKQNWRFVHNGISLHLNFHKSNEIYCEAFCREGDEEAKRVFWEHAALLELVAKDIIARKSKENLKANPKTEVAVKEQVNPKGKEGNKGSIKERIRKKRGAGTKGLLGDIMNQIKEEQSNNKPSKD